MTLLSLTCETQDGLIPTPSELLKTLPLTSMAEKGILEARQTLRDILNGEDPRLLLIVGPCSIHDPSAAYEYAEKLHRLAHEVSHTFFIVMRCYFEKPRTLKGWKGFFYDPYLDGSFDIAAGLQKGRRLLLDLATLGMPVASELLEITTAHYFTDLLAWGCIGARTAASQPHRQLASSLPFPIGFKNSIDGNVDHAIHGVLSAEESHTFIGTLPSGQLSKVQTEGNPDCHIVLRGGRREPNYDSTSIETAAERCSLYGINEKIIVDCSHDNCRKMHESQIDVFNSVLSHIIAGNRSVCGLMLESNLHAGSQPISPRLEYGVSITDPCLDWTATERLILRASNSINKYFN